MNGGLDESLAQNERGYIMYMYRFNNMPLENIPL